MSRRVAMAAALGILIASRADAAPTVRGVGTVDASGAGVSPGLPTGTQVGDLLLMCCETAGTQAMTGATGWNIVQVDGGANMFSDVGTSTTGSRATVLYRIATGTDPTATGDSGNHQMCRIMGIHAGTFDASDPFGTGIANQQTSATTAVSISGTTAASADSLIVAVATTPTDTATDTAGFSSGANANLSSFTERIDNRTDVANGGALGVWTGVLAGATDWGTTTATSADSDLHANLSFEVRAAPPTPTFTVTATGTHTATATVTATPTVTQTPTVTDTFTATPTATVTATVTDTPTIAVTDTPTVTPTWTLGPDRHWCPDLTGDNLCGITFAGDEQLRPILDPLKWTLSGPAMLCDQFETGAYNPEVRQEQQALATPGAGFGLCDPYGDVIRGADVPADLVIIDPTDVHAYVDTMTAPRIGICRNTGEVCRVDAPPHGYFDQYADGNARCIHGANTGDDCIPPMPGVPSVGCAEDPAPESPVNSYCQRNVWRTGDDGVTVINCGFPAMCQIRHRIAWSRQNVEGVLATILDSGRQPILLLPPNPPLWAGKVATPTPTGEPTPTGSPRPVDCDPDPQEITCDAPDGVSFPQPLCRSPWEPAWCDHAELRAQYRVLADTFRYQDRLCDDDGDCQALETCGINGRCIRPLPLIDCHRAFALATNGQTWQGFGDARYPSTKGEGSCACVGDADCGIGGACDPDHYYCTAGERASCTTDTQCWGSRSITHPALPHCITELGMWMCANAVRACLEGEPDGVYAAFDVIRCDGRIPRPPDYEPPPTFTPPATVTATGTVTQTRTPSSTATPTPAVPEDTVTPGGPDTPTVTATATITETPTPSTPTPFNCSHTLACDKIATTYRAVKFHFGHIGALSGRDYGYVPTDSGGLGLLIEPLIGAASEPTYTQPGGGIPNLIHCGDIHSSPPACTNDEVRGLGHLGDAKWPIDGCTIDDGYWLWYWAGAPELTYSAQPPFNFSPVCDIYKYAGDPRERAWEFARCVQEVFNYPVLTYALQHLRAYGRCSIATDRGCDGDADCAYDSGGVCQSYNSGDHADGFLSHNCASRIWHTIADRLSAHIIPSHDDDPSLSTTKNWTERFRLYNDWDTSANSSCRLTGTAYKLKQDGKRLSSGAIQYPQCPDDLTDGGLAALDCKTYFTWVRDTLRTANPLIWACRERFEGAMAWEPKWCTGNPLVQCEVAADCAAAGGSCEVIP